MRSAWSVGLGVSLGVSIASALIARPGYAQAPSPSTNAPTVPALVPPVPQMPLRAEYPEGAHGDASVRLVVVVNDDGSVRLAFAEDGPDPFAAAAVAAAGSFVFRPATRGGVPVAAKIRVEIRFTAPAPERPTAPGRPTAPELPAAAEPLPVAGRPRKALPAPKPIEVIVRGEQLSPGVTSLSRAEVRLLPGAFGDPFRAIDMLPGVTPIFTGVPFFYVRGAPPGNVGYFLDGIRVPLLYHLGLGPSVVHPAIVDRVDLYPGGYPARYGRYAGGIVAGETKPPFGEWHGEGVVRLVDAGALVEAPFADGRGAALVGGRYSYTGTLLSIAAPEVTLNYWDYQARLGFSIAPRDRIALFAFGAHDFLANTEAGETSTLFDTTFHRLDLRYDHDYGTSRRVRSAAMLGYDRTQIDEGRWVDARILAARVEVDHQLDDGTPLRAGLDGTLEDNGQHLGDRSIDGISDDDAQIDAFLSEQVGFAAGAFAYAEIEVAPGFFVTPGLRLDFFVDPGSSGLPGSIASTEAAVAVDPRLSSRLEVTPWLRLVQAHGLASQTPSFVLPVPGVRPRLSGGLQRSFQSSAGVELDLPEDITAKATFFHNAFFNMTDAIGVGNTDDDAPLLLRALGSGVGMEISAHRRLTHRLGGFVSYTLSRSSRYLGTQRIASSVDRTHVLNAAAVYDVGRGYKAGGRFVFYSGVPQGKRDEQELPQGWSAQPVDWEPPPWDGPPRWERLPPFFRLDIRLEKRWTVSRTGWLSVVLEVLNATLSKELVPRACDFYSTCEPEEIGPVTIPSLGLEGGF